MEDEGRDEAHHRQLQAMEGARLEAEARAEAATATSRPHLGEGLRRAVVQPDSEPACFIRAWQLLGRAATAGPPTSVFRHPADVPRV